MTTLHSLDKACKHYSDARTALAEQVTELNAVIEALKRQHLPRIKQLVARAAEHHSTLEFQIKDAPDLFQKPRTIVLHGIKIGYQKGKGGILIADPALTLRKIGELLDCPENYIRTTEAPNKEALANLPAADLKKLGCTLVGTGDEVVIKPTDTAVDKLVTALLKSATDESQTEAA